MERIIYSADFYPVPVGVEEVTPVCGEDFCDRCGDCLACDPEGPCYGGGGEEEEHLWVRYLEEK